MIIMSYSITHNETFTVTNAKYLASKVATDLKRIQRLYGNPSDLFIEKFQVELIELLSNGYLKYVTYGYKRGDIFIAPTLVYRASELANIYSIDDDPGKIKPGADISNAHFSSFLEYSQKWWDLNEESRIKFELNLPLQRSTGSNPVYNGYLTQDNNYYSNGVSLNRSTLNPY